MVRRFLKNGRDFLFQKQESILSAASLIMLTVLASRLLGLVRDRMLATFLPVESLGVYFAAFRLPDTIFQILILSSLSSAFIPVFTSFLEKKDLKSAWWISSSVINIGAVLFLIPATLVFVFAHPLSSLIAPGFNPDQIQLMADLTRIMLFAQFFFVLSNFLTGILESFQRFVIPALAPLFYNLGIILATIFLSPRWGIYAPAFGVVLGAFWHFLIQLPPAFSLGWRPRRAFDLSHPGVREMGRLMLPRTLGLMVAQLSQTANVMLASLISAGSLAFLNFADHLQFLPVGLFGLSLGKASLPTLAREANHDLRAFRSTFLTSLNQILFLTIPTSVFLLVLRIPVVRLAFGASRFTWESTVLTGYTLAAFCLGIFAQGASYLLNRAFYALHDTDTPVKIGVFSTALNIFLSAFLILKLKLPVWGLALSFSAASILSVLCLLYFLDRRVGGFDRLKLIIPFSKISLSSVISGGLMYFLLKILDRSAWDKKLSFLGRLTMPERFESFVLDTRYTTNLIVLTLIVASVGVLSYLFLIYLLKVKEAKAFLKVFKRFKSLPRCPTA